MVVKRWRLRALRACQVTLLVSPGTIYRSHGRVDASPRLVGGMVKKRADIVNEERIQLLRDLLLVGKIQRAIEWDPNQVSISPTELDTED